MAKQLKASAERTKTPRASKIRPVPIAEMRVPPALVTQRPFIPAHADYLSANLELEKLGFPVINHRDGIYWILDGQHRVHALRENGFGEETLDCEVYEGLTDAEMANVFLGRDARKSVNPYAKFHIAVTANYDVECSVLRTVESNGLKIGKTREQGNIGCVSALRSVHEKHGAVVLGQSLRAIRDAFGSDAAAFDAQVIKGIALVFNRYNGKTNEKVMVDQLSRVQLGARGLLRRAEALRVRTGNDKPTCVAATVVDVYNKGAQTKGKLPSWWKDASE
jgi:hypothetical protein